MRWGERMFCLKFLPFTYIYVYIYIFLKSIHIFLNKKEKCEEIAIGKGTFIFPH